MTPLTSYEPQSNRVGVNRSACMHPSPSAMTPLTNYEAQFKQHRNEHVSMHPSPLP
ncbi:hypothetical protein BKA82DRAFT_1007089 [Pisolithus tinctorius]|uniref:Uncharacterized protein n=1 Tax=Pisolithus tinctorius Marx 270 TaxID=870435 RepID=A0A0C3N4G1_PISTI|nr:hypothetical protein BKA82DRAFT_1007089 [Pisolithus tinctorius]KIN95934.1 hypothetical protein M404DRAFT_1007089 [Pisolithus tinctorius Marx 270]